MGYCGLFNFHPLPVSLAASGGISTGHVHVSDCTGVHVWAVNRVVLLNVKPSGDVVNSV